MLTLFDHASIALESKVFRLDKQSTFLAIGMEAGDYITFEVVKVKAAAMAKICGCFLTGTANDSIEGIEELQCPGCVAAPVTLHAQSPMLILDAPQNTLIRAVYHGTGIDSRTVIVWMEETATQDLTDAMRGCAPACTESTHATPTVSVSPASGDEGSTFCWLVTLDGPVTGDPIYLMGILTGTEQDLYSYPFPTGVIYPGQSSVQLCVDTQDCDVLADKQLCLQLAPNARFAGVPAPVCATVVHTG